MYTNYDAIVTNRLDVLVDTPSQKDTILTNYYGLEHLQNVQLSI